MNESVEAILDPDSQAPTPPLDEFRMDYEQNDNLWWRVSSGHHQNLFDAACERIDDLEATVRALSL